MANMLLPCLLDTAGFSELNGFDFTVRRIEPLTTCCLHGCTIRGHLVIIHPNNSVMPLCAAHIHELIQGEAYGGDYLTALDVTAYDFGTTPLPTPKVCGDNVRY